MPLPLITLMSLFLRLPSNIFDTRYSLTEKSRRSEAFSSHGVTQTPNGLFKIVFCDLHKEPAELGLYYLSGKFLIYDLSFDLLFLRNVPDYTYRSK